MQSAHSAAHINDPAIAVRLRRDKSWYQWKTWCRLLQAYGRIVRDSSDYGETFFFDRTFDGLVRRAGSFQPKWFRSFFVQTMVDGGVPMAMASKMVGHEDIRTTQAHDYALSADRRRAIGEGISV